MYRFMTIIVTLAALTFLSFPAAAQEPPGTLTFNFQGRLNNALGNPVPDGNYQMRFFIYADSVGGTPLWTELHPAVPIVGGFFNLDAGSVTPCSLGIPSLENIYLATQIGTEPPMARRFRISSAPSSGVARRIYGDLQSSPGSLMLSDPINARSAITLHTEVDSSQRAGITIGFTPPPDPWHGTSIQLGAGATAAGLSVMSIPPDPYHQMSAEINVDSSQAQVNLDDMVTGSGVSLNTGSEVMGLVIEERPGSDAARRFFAGVESGEVALGFEGPNGQRLFDVSGMPGSLGSIGWRMFNPQPEPPGNEGRLMMEGTSNPGGSISWRMFNPQPEPPGHPGLSMEVGSSGPDLRLFAPQVGGGALANNHPQIKLSSDVSTSSLLLQRAFSSVEGDDSIGVLVRADSSASEMRFYKGGTTQAKISSSASGTSMKFFDDGSEYMGVEPTPWHAGGDLTMRDPTGGQTIVLSSTGYIAIGATTMTNILTIRQNSTTDPIADAWTTYSSRRWKTNIQPLQGSLDKVMRLNGVSFDWIEGGKHDIGLIAEDVGQVVPEVVAYEENGIDAQSIDYARLSALLIEAVKEQQKMIDQLKSELLELKAEVYGKQASFRSGE